MNKFDKNIKLLSLIFTLNNSPMYFFTGIYLYFVTNSYFLTSIIIATTMVTKGIMEIPNGIVSDKFLGRKGTYISACVFRILALILLIAGKFHIGFLFLSRIFQGIGLAFNSGNDQALIYESVENSTSKKDFHYYFGKFRSYKYLHWGFSLIIAGLLSKYYNLTAIIYYCLVIASTQLLLLFFIEETNAPNKEIKSEHNFRFVKDAVKQFKKNPKLRLLASIRILRKGLFFAVDKFCTVFYELFISHFQIGILTACSLFLCSFLAKLTNKITDILSKEKAMFICNLISIPMSLFAYTKTSVFSPIIVELSHSTNAIYQTTISSVLQKEYVNKYRATTDSLIEILGTVFYVIIAGLIGYLSDVVGLANALAITVLVRIFTLFLDYKLYKNKEL